ncbi:MAG TPA: Smr/MutS family protein [Candidatus Acidoferrales bacterium]|nr:Smr/MutS family protein [Candidatus Acidoferrales bacterium]
MPRTAEELLEFDKLRELLRLRTTCAPGRRAIEALVFSRERAALESAFALIREAREWLRAGRELGFGALADPEGWLAKIEGPGAVLEARELLDAASLLETAGWLRQQFREDAASFPLLAARASAVADFRDALSAIRRCILPNAEISDDASPALRRIRASIIQTRDTIQKSLKQLLRARNAEAGEDYVTLRNDRFVIPVRAEQRRSVPGVVHGASATGQTVFLEPFETVEANNQLVQLAEDESAEILRILRELTVRLQNELPALLAAAALIAELDGIFARARFARDFDAVVPDFSGSDHELRFVAARHPVLEDKLKRENRAVVPMSLALGGAERVLVISGPNTGGKTVALKTTGLAALSAQSGIPVAAQSALLPLFDHVLVDIGDEQSIAADLSTFSAHMLNLKSMLAAATRDSLVLADEMGTGTAPEEGAALAVALLDEFRAKESFVLATTHHDRLKAWASTTQGVVNAAVEFDDVNLRPTYRLMVGVPGGSSGIAIAQRLGLAAQIIDRARALLTPESREAADLIAYLHRSRDELDRMQRQMSEGRRALEEERAKLRTEWVERQQKRIRELEGQFAEMQKRFEENVSRVVEAVKERELRASLEKTSRRKLQEVRGEAREELNAAVVQTISESQPDLGTSNAASRAVNLGALQNGMRIRLRGFAKPVIFRRMDGSSAEIEAGPLRMKVAADEIIAVESAIVSSPAAGTTSVSRVGRAATESATAAGGRNTAASGEVNVIGMTVEQASEVVDKFLDDAALAHQPSVRIIHGHGTGALRRGLADFLKTHPLVAAQSFEAEERGGKAVTVVQLRS